MQELQFAVCIREHQRRERERAPLATPRRAPASPAATMINGTAVCETHTRYLTPN